MATAENDSRLIERVGRGDREAFEQLYKRFARPVFGMALRQLGDNGRAEDAAQETFAAVWRSAKSYKAERGTASAWLYAVARHAIIDRARQKRENAVEVPEEADARAGPVERAECTRQVSHDSSARSTGPARVSASSGTSTAFSRFCRARSMIAWRATA